MEPWLMRWALVMMRLAKKRAAKWRAWNKGIELGQKDALAPDQVKKIRELLARRGARGLRDLALFSVAIDTMLQGPELLNLTVKDVRRSDGKIRSVIEVGRRRKPPVRCALSKVSANALGKWIAVSGKKRADYIFSGRRDRSSRPMRKDSTPYFLGLSPASEIQRLSRRLNCRTVRRTKALHILNGTGDLEAVRVLLGHTKLESTARYLHIAKRSDPIAISRAFDI
jgi:integrase